MIDCSSFSVMSCVPVQRYWSYAPIFGALPTASFDISVKDANCFGLSLSCCVSMLFVDLTARAICSLCLFVLSIFRFANHFLAQRITSRIRIAKLTISTISQIGIDSEKLLLLAFMMPKFIVSAVLCSLFGSSSLDPFFPMFGPRQTELAEYGAFSSCLMSL